MGKQTAGIRDCAGIYAPQSQTSKSSESKTLGQLRAEGRKSSGSLPFASKVERFFLILLTADMPGDLPRGGKGARGSEDTCSSKNDGAAMDVP